ncbi:hypothetical protein [Bacteriovorax sp. Seq25_V]|uniref:hypothetical protein n=1 Tax=Bacteriovorax sp. Seq25_V TaxID=1201288 RepID=UPI000389DCAD|nr:hypothetical protein [Bacteriovorax sp. Seq25_V]EQC45613.1 hypothetical protein M900_2085 [Bacteriovorax sp. Seq25_V]
MKILISFLFVMSAWSSECVNADFIAKGFKFANKKSFSTISKNITKWMNSAENEFVLDYQSPMYSSSYKGFVTVTSYDNLSTERDEMFGDVVFLRDRFTDKLVEVRWYQNGMKLIAFDRELQECPAPVVPVAENALL